MDFVSAFIQFSFFYLISFWGEIIWGFSLSLKLHLTEHLSQRMQDVSAILVKHLGSVTLSTFLLSFKPKVGPIMAHRYSKENVKYVNKYANKGGWMQNKVQYTRLVKDESVNW